MKKVPLFFLLAVLLTASFFLSKVPESKISLLIIAFVYHIVVAGYISLVAHHSDLQSHIIKPAKFNDYTILVYALFGVSIFLGGYFGTSADYVPFFGSVFGLLIGILVGGITAHRLADKKIENWLLIKFKTRFLF